MMTPRLLIWSLGRRSTPATATLEMAEDGTAHSCLVPRTTTSDLSGLSASPLLRNQLLISTVQSSSASKDVEVVV